MLETKAGPIDGLDMEVSHLRAMFCMHCLDNIFTCATHCLSYYSLNSLCFIRFEFVCKSILSSICTGTGWLFLHIVGCTTNCACCILCSLWRLHLVWCFTGIPQSFSSNLAFYPQSVSMSRQRYSSSGFHHLKGVPLL